jgi:hypothetical protein
MSMSKVQCKTRSGLSVGLSHDLGLHTGSHFLDPEEATIERESRPPARPRVVVRLDPMSDLDLAIANGWGNTPQNRLPADWRTRKQS